MYKMRWSICLVIMFMHTPALGEFYRYVDKSGHVKYTDDLSQVPEEQRPKAKAYIESKGIQEEKTDDSVIVEEEPVQSSRQQFDLVKSRLDKEKLELEKEYEGMMKEQKALSEEKKTAKTRIQIQKHNKKALKFNETVAAYEKKKKALDDEIRKFNAEIKRDLKEKLKNAKKK